MDGWFGNEGVGSMHVDFLLVSKLKFNFVIEVSIHHFFCFVCFSLLYFSLFILLGKIKTCFH